MTLSRQLFALVSALFLLIYLGTFLINVEITRTYLGEQLGSHAQDAATSLGLSIKPYFEKDDKAMIEVTINSIFDRGYYREVLVETILGETIVERTVDVKVKGAPEWFIKLIPLETPLGEALITSGWSQVAKIKVRSHPGYAYKQLWNSAVETIRWALISLVIIMSLLFIALRFALKPLEKIERQALAICGREFPIQEKIPYTREFRHAVVAMNKMTTKVEKMLGEQAELSNELRKEAYEDPLTKLENRRSCMTRLELVTSDTEEVFGALYLIRFLKFAEYNDEHGMEAGDKLLVDAGASIKQIVTDYYGVTLARISGSEFAVFIRDIDTKEARVIAGYIAERLKGLEQITTERIVFNMGVGYYTGEVSLSGLLSQTDTVLRMAEKEAPNSWDLMGSQDTQEILGAQQWKILIELAIENNDFMFYYQPVYSLKNKSLIHYEVLSRIFREGEAPLSAGLFFPVAERYNLSGPIDRLNVISIFEEIRKSGNKDTHFAVNISPYSIRDESFVDGLFEIIQKYRDVAGLVSFEISEHGALQSLDYVRKFIERLGQHGMKFGLDNFGARDMSFSHLQSLKVDYIKVWGSYVQNIDQERKGRFYVKSISDIAHGLDMEVIGEFVEKEEEWKVLGELGLDGGMGYYLGKPDESPS